MSQGERLRKKREKEERLQAYDRAWEKKIEDHNAKNPQNRWSKKRETLAQVTTRHRAQLRYDRDESGPRYHFEAARKKRQAATEKRRRRAIKPPEPLGEAGNFTRGGPARSLHYREQVKSKKLGAPRLAKRRNRKGSRR